LKIKILDKSNPLRRHAFLKQNSMKLDVIISTPLRLLQMIREGVIKLDQVQWLVLDEADRLLDDGFDEQVGHLMLKEFRIEAFE
jgi:superfamily II DNA/RNA helicase